MNLTSTILFGVIVAILVFFAVAVIDGMWFAEA